jgi:endogenous inhibitor of DNA gyrase (YacG/DUF329 family)
MSQSPVRFSCRSVFRPFCSRESGIELKVSMTSGYIIEINNLNT